MRNKSFGRANKKCNLKIKLKQRKYSSVIAFKCYSSVIAVGDRNIKSPVQFSLVSVDEINKEIKRINP